MKIKTNDTAGLDEKWKYEEYFDLDGNKKRRYFTPAAWAKRQARQQLKKKTTPDVRPYVWRLGYNNCVGQYCPYEEFPSLSGSSLNRSLTRKRKKGARLFEVVPFEKVSGQEPRRFSKRSRGKVKDKATAFFRSIKREQRFFVTLTFIQHLSDKDGVKILNKFLTMLRREKPGLFYLWVAEHQPENEAHTIHFHIMLNKRMDIRRFNALWVLQQYNAGLRGKSAEGREITRSEILQRYKHDLTAKFRKRDPDSVQAVLNPFDINKAQSIEGLSYYLTKYVTKQQAKDEFGCQNWHCSRRVSRLFTREVVSPSTFAYLCSFANSRVDYDTGEITHMAEPVTKQWFSMVYVNNKAAPLARLRQMEQVNKWILEHFEPDKLPILNDNLYRKILMNGETTFDLGRRLPRLSKAEAQGRLFDLPAVKTNSKKKDCKGPLADGVRDDPFYGSGKGSSDRELS